MVKNQILANQKESQKWNFGKFEMVQIFVFDISEVVKYAIVNSIA